MFKEVEEKFKLIIGILGNDDCISHNSLIFTKFLVYDEAEYLE